MHSYRFAAAPAALLLAAAPALAGGGTGDLAITEVCDGTLTGGQPKWVQLTNVGTATIGDLSVYRIYNFNNGGNTNSFDADPLNAVALAPGDSYVIAYENFDNVACDPAMTVSCFEFVYGAPPDQFVGPFTNGDDVYVLLQGGGIGTTAGGPGNGSDGCIVDIFGELDQDGTGEAWEYTDSHAWRCGNGSLATWTACDWTLPGPNALETGDDVTELALLQSQTTPFSHPGCVPGPCAPTSFCNGQPGDTAGCLAALSASSGSMPSAGAGDFTVTAGNMQGTVNGVFFVSLTGPFNATTFPGGILCVKAPLGRMGFGNSGGTSAACDGSLAVLLNDPTASWAPFLVSGTDAWIQCYYRDAGSITGLSLSNALYVQLQ